MSTPALSEGPDDILVRVQELQARLDSSGDSVAPELAEELVSAVVQMYGAGLERIVDSLLADFTALSGRSSNCATNLPSCRICS